MADYTLNQVNDMYVDVLKEIGNIVYITDIDSVLLISDFYNNILFSDIFYCFKLLCHSAHPLLNQCICIQD